MNLAFITISQFTVSEARARILGPADVYVKTGSTLSLTCLMSQSPHDLGTVSWYRANEVIIPSVVSKNDVKIDEKLRGIIVETEWSEVLTSR